MEKLTREVMYRILLLSCPLLLPPPPHLFGTWECWPRVQPGDPSRSPQLHLEDDGGRWERGMLQRRGSCSQTCVLRLWCLTTVKNSLQIITCTKALHHSLYCCLKGDGSLRRQWLENIGLHPWDRVLPRTLWSLCSQVSSEASSWCFPLKTG